MKLIRRLLKTTLTIGPVVSALFLVLLNPACQGGNSEQVLVADNTFWEFAGNMTYDGNSPRTTSGVADLAACETQCAADANCNLLTYDPSGKNCYTMNTVLNGSNISPPTTNIVYNPNNRSDFVTWNASTVFGQDRINGGAVANQQACMDKCTTLTGNSENYPAYGVYGPSFITQFAPRSDGQVDCWCKSTRLTCCGGLINIHDWSSWTTAVRTSNR